MKLSVCIPMYNECDIISGTLGTLCSQMSRLSEDTGISCEVIFFDDGSTDGCGDIIREKADEKSTDKVEIKIFRHDVNRGKGSAVRNAVLRSEGDIVVYTDSDLAYGTDVIGYVCRTLSQNGSADILIGSRNLTRDGYEGYTFIRKIMSKAYIKFLNITAGFTFSDSQCSIKAFRGECARRVFSMCKTDGFAFDIEVILTALKCGYKISEFPVKIINHNNSKVRIVRDTLKMLSDIAKIKRHIRDLDISRAGRREGES